MVELFDRIPGFHRGCDSRPDKHGRAIRLHDDVRVAETEEEAFDVDPAALPDPALQRFCDSEHHHVPVLGFERAFVDLKSVDWVPVHRW